MDEKELIRLIKEAADNKVTELDLSGKGIKELPPEIGELKNLIILKLSSNQLTSLPAEIGELSKLWGLYLDSNRLTSLPQEIGELTNLHWLYIENNRLSSLPSEIKNLINLQTFKSSDNLLPIPDEIIGRSNEPATIIDYYIKYIEDLERRALNEAKMILVGQGAVGKTSIVNRLIAGIYNEDEEKTEGIDIKQWRVESNGKDVRLNVWDFGGQEIMHATHQFFMTRRSLYILVLDARKGERDSKIEYWLKLIQSFGGDSPVIVVLNKIDEQQLYVDKSGLMRKYTNIKAFVDTSCKENIGIDDLRATIKKTAAGLDHINMEWLLNWFEIKTKLENMEPDHISYKEYEDMCIEEGVDEIGCKTLIRFLHDLGIVLCFEDDPYLEQLSILNPEWVTGGVYRILNCNELFKSQGVLELNQLDHILDKVEYPRDKHLFIVGMMKKFELCFEFEGDKNKYLIPELLPKNEPDINWNENDALNFQYHYNFLPNSIISRFIVRSQRLISKKTYWRTGVMLKYKGNKALIRADLEDNKIFISISGKESTRREFLAVIRDYFVGIHDTIAKIEVKEMVPVPGYDKKFVDYQLVREAEDEGDEKIRIQGVKKRISVKKLIGGVKPLKKEEKARERTLQISYWKVVGLIFAYLAVFIILIVALGFLSKNIDIQFFVPILIGSNLILYAIANYSLVATGILSEKGFLSLMRGFLKSVAKLSGKKEE